MAIELYNRDGHICLAFENLVRGEGIQANQFLVIHGKHAALIDPGGNLTYTPLSIEISRRISIRDLDYVFASHQDPDIITSLDKWLIYTDCTVVISRLWERFLPHLVPGYMENQPTGGRVLGIPDRGMSVPFGDSVIQCLPAHFLHSVGNFSFYDPVSKILFSGDIGASVSTGTCKEPVQDFEKHLEAMTGFHQRYMNSNRACRLWVNMVRNLNIDMIVPQHGCVFQGKEMVNRFLDWLEQLQCGVDLMGQNDYALAN